MARQPKQTAKTGAERAQIFTTRVKADKEKYKAYKDKDKERKRANQTHQAQVKLPERKGLTGRESRSAEPKKMLTRTSQIPSLQNTSSPWKSNW